MQRIRTRGIFNNKSGELKTKNASKTPIGSIYRTYIDTPLDSSSVDRKRNMERVPKNNIMQPVAINGNGKPPAYKKTVKTEATKLF